MKWLGIAIFLAGCCILVALAAAYWMMPVVPHFWRFAGIGVTVLGVGLSIANAWQDERVSNGFEVTPRRKDEKA